ncbi:MAG: 50S ribosomal protein L24 [Clostridiales bacterium]|jgi:large subunit ribosomal protein L24|nr:50S ribosomal protein L24 [Clostridiales bacterium]
MAKKAKSSKLKAVKIRLKKGDNVQVIAGKDKGKSGKILVVDKEKNRAIVEGLNMITKHQKPNRSNQRGGIVNKEAHIHVSNLMFLHHNKPTRLGYKVQVIENDGIKTVTKQRIAVSTGEVVD